MYPQCLRLFHNLSSSYSIPHTCEQSTLVFQGMRGITELLSTPAFLQLSFYDFVIAAFSHLIKVEVMRADTT